MRHKIALMLALVALAGCQSSTDPSNANVYGSPVGQRVVGNKEGVMISNVWNELDAFPVAERHCKQYGRSAKFKSSQGYRASFDCV
ncbi:hypothetical protein [Neorhizobium galegae]|uniref:Lipoprotein n=1 Tax=Neorhizobium galegae bv. orientalis str. HAMBI 540 TaxID=1028800 RepID=A0A068SMS0_NEOGA|nr:hypothetical protein [Neorhizobium galegae]CDN47582.1 Hypothetical protein RG540_CH14020 [Neorhizobium galegae bv. orientalis str. HAMBI 540]